MDRVLITSSQLWARERSRLLGIDAGIAPNEDILALNILGGSVMGTDLGYSRWGFGQAMSSPEMLCRGRSNV